MIWNLLGLSGPFSRGSLYDMSTLFIAVAVPTLFQDGSSIEYKAILMNINHMEL